MGNLKITFSKRLFNQIQYSLVIIEVIAGLKMIIILCLVNTIDHLIFKKSRNSNELIFNLVKSCDICTVFCIYQGILMQTHCMLCVCEVFILLSVYFDSGQKSPGLDSI